MWDNVLKLALVVAAGAIVAAIILNAQTLKDWINRHINQDTLAVVLERELEAGNYNLVCGVFDKREELSAITSWVNVELDEDLNQLFGDRNRVILTIA